MISSSLRGAKQSRAAGSCQPPWIASRARNERRMNFTDIFIRRPVLASVVSLLILVLGLRAYSALPILQYPRTENAHRHRHHDLLRRRSRRGRRLHHHAAGKRHRPGQRHRLHELDQPERHQHHHRLPAAQLRCRQGADRDQHQDQFGPQSAADRHAAADPDGQDRPVHRRHVYRLQQRYVGAEPDHRLSGARGAAEAAGGDGRADRRTARAARFLRCAPGSIRKSSRRSGSPPPTSARRSPPTTTFPASAIPKARWCRSI